MKKNRCLCNWKTRGMIYIYWGALLFPARPFPQEKENPLNYYFGIIKKK